MKRTQSSSQDLAQMTNEPERAERNIVYLLFRKTFCRQESTVQKPIEKLKAALSSDAEGPPSIPEYGKSLPPESISQFFNDPQLRSGIGQIARKVARLICALEMDKGHHQAAEDGFLELFQIVFESANGGFKNTSSDLWKVYKEDWRTKAYLTRCLNRK